VAWRTHLALMGLALGVLSCVDTALADAARMVTGPSGRGPAAFDAFCRRFPDQCGSRGARAGSIPLTAARLDELRSINRAVNASVVEKTDRDVYGREDVWAIPTAGVGDCEDFALLKRKMLLERGWPSSVLLMTVVRTPAGEGHAVLTVVTDQGDYVLDNRTSTMKLWSETGYEFYLRQSQASPRGWVWVEDRDNSVVRIGLTARTREGSEPTQRLVPSARSNMRHR
jgi:predicted transglutaminase-like cysteine proteinase